jgi:hypothetical protein
VPVDALESEINEQVGQVRAALHQARVAQDEYLADLHEAELADLARTADAHGVRISPDPVVELDRPTVDLTATDLAEQPDQARSA